MPSGTFNQFWRIRTESSFDAASPEDGGEWNDGFSGGTHGWMDLPVMRESDSLQPKSTIIYPSTASGSRAMNAALPIAGAYPAELGTLEMAVYLELCDRLFKSAWGDVSRTETAGSMSSAGAQNIDADPKTITPGVQSNSTEQIKIIVAATVANTNAKIEIIRDGSTLETIYVGSGADCNGTYYTKGGYDGSANSISLKFTGMGTAGNATITGVDKVTNEFTAGTSTPSLVIEQGGRPEAGSGNSEFFPGCCVPTLVFSYDRSAPDNLLMLAATVLGLNPDTATAGTYADDASEYYKPLAGWEGSVTFDAGAYSELVAASMTIQPNNALYAVSSGSQQSSGLIEGEFEVFGELTILPADETMWGYYRNQTVKDVELTFTTPHYIIDTTGYSIKFEFTQMTFGDYTRNRQGQALAATVPFRAIYDSTDGPCKMTTVCRMPV